MGTFIATVLYILLVGFFASKCKDNESATMLIIFAIIIGIFTLASNRSLPRCDTSDDCLEMNDTAY